MAKSETSLFARMVVRVAAVLLFGAAGLVVAAWFYARTAADVAYDRLLQGAAVQIVENLAIIDGKVEVTVPASAFKLLALAERDRIFYRVIGPQGRTLTGYADLQPDPRKLPKSDEVSLLSTHFRGSPVRMAIAGRRFFDPSFTGPAYAIVAQTTEARHALISELTSRATGLVGIMSLFGLAGAVLAVGYSLRPLNRLGAALRQRDPRDLTELAVEAPREMRPFVDSINHFMGRLGGRLKQSERFVADSAHQIRTPLTAISAQLNMVDETGLDQASREHLDRARERVTEMARLIHQLLSHALVIHRFESTALAPVDLVAVTRHAFRAAVPITIDPDIVVSFEAPETPVIVMADTLSLREAITNIIDNAVRHGAAARLEVRVRTEGETQAVVEVEDDGPGIGAEDWTRLTQRFAASSGGKGVSGLGFAIASEVTQALGGRLWHRPATATERFAVVMTLPLAPEAADRKEG